jgi:hypothetical protein
VPLYAMRVVYRGTVLGGELRNEVGGSSDEARWFPLAEVPRLNAREPCSTSRCA